MAEKISERDVRIQKTQTLRSIGIKPYAQSWDKNTQIGDLIAPLGKGVVSEGSEWAGGFDTQSLRTIEEIIASPTTTISIAGRLMLYRTHGKLSFGRLMDETGEIQIMRHRDNCNMSTKIITQSLPHFFEGYEGFIDQQDSLLQEHGIINIGIDHIAYQVASQEQYESYKKQLQQFGILISEALFGGRKISVIQLFSPISYKHHKIECIELIEPTPGEQSGREHVEYIVESLDDFVSQMPLLSRNTDKINDPINPRIKLNENGLIKVHTKTLAQAVELQNSSQEFSKDIISKQEYYSPYKIVEKLIDVGDIIGVKGELFVTHKGELTVFVSEYQLLSKAIRPLGDKFHGIGEDNQETAYRQRYLDMIFNRESLERMKLRSQFVKTLREFYWSHGFMELDTPILGNSASGAAAAPFVTHHNDFDTDMYLRIAPEIALKMATVGGLERVFEIGKDFRNEGSSPSHHQEFLVAEHYAMYWNYEDNMRFTEQMFNYLFDHIPQLSRSIQVADKQGVVRQVTFGNTWERIDYIERIKSDSGIDVSQFGPDDDVKLRELIKSKGHDRQGLDIQTTATMIDYLYKKVTRPKIIGPAFIYNYPKTMQPLARTSDADGNIVEQFQAIVNGWEILKAYSELVDPVELQSNFDAQADALARGDDEATKSDDEFVLSMEYGMAPQSGWGMGLDRILAMLTEQANIRDVIMFPMMKPEL